MEKDIYRLKINEKFASVTPPLKKCEREMLEKSLIENGCQMPLIVWNGTIVDGHQRYNICREHRIPFTYEEMDFNSESEAIVWIIKNQMARRNLSSFQRCEMVLRFEPELKADAEQHRRDAISYYRSTGKTLPANKRTRELLANMAGTSGRTLDRAKKIMTYGDEETIRRVRNGEISITHAYNSVFGRSGPKQHPMDDDNRVPLSEIGDAVSSLREKVANGDASQKMMLQELDHISSLIEGGL